MKQEITIILFEEYKDVNFYSIVIGSNEDCEMESYLKYLQSQNKNKDAVQIVNLLTKIGQNGAQERYFRYEGKRHDHVCALPGHYLFDTKCRLYCLRYGDLILVLGNGGIKKTKTYQEDPHLNTCVTTLQNIDVKIQELIKSGDIEISGKTISGKLSFFI